MTNRCHVVDGDCSGVYSFGVGRMKCYACGLPVCKNCSTLRPWYRANRARVCTSCTEEEERFAKMAEQRKQKEGKNSNA